MALRLFNTLTRSLEKFVPLYPPDVGLYTCGPTVYDHIHLGNLRAFFTADILRRTLLYSGYKVKQVMNITDVDDKTIKGSQKANENIKDFTARYEASFRKDLAVLNVLPPDVLPRASEHVSAMISLIEKLLEKGYAYKADDGIYFNIEKAPNYGNLAQLEKRKKGARSRVSNDDYDKENAEDFALWKLETKEDGDVGWESPFGRGRPGWHIECSAMSMKYLGDHFDIHTGGVDLIFPHHTNEIAQSESATGEKFVNLWLHSGFINMHGGKMAKREGNILTLGGIKKLGFSPLAYRFFLLGTHYRKPIEWGEEAMAGAQNSFDKLCERFLELGGNPPAGGGSVDEKFKNKFLDGLNDDLNTSLSLSIVWETLKDASLSPSDKKATLLDFDRVLGLGLDKLENIKIPKEVEGLIALREEARGVKDWKKTDSLREKMKKLGFTVKDTGSGPKITKRRGD